MQILAHNQPGPGRESGFSLLELLVVLAIMGLMLSLVGTRMVSNIEGARFVRTAEAAISDVLIVRADAMMSGQPRTLITHSQPSEKPRAESPRETLRRFDVPADWRVEGSPIEISPSGVCSGGIIAMQNPQGRRIVFTLSPPRCAPERLSLGI